MTRSRAADRTQEITAADILDEVPAEDYIPVDFEPAPPPEIASAPSISPISLSVEPPPSRRPAETTFKIRAVSPRRKELGLIVTVAMGISVAILVAAGLRAAIGSSVATAAPAVLSSLPPVIAAVAPQAGSQASGAWHTAGTTSSAPTSGTITSKGVTLFVDGARISAKSAVVSCGRHTLKAGRGKAHDVDVPCGGTLIVDRSGKATPTPAHG